MQREPENRPTRRCSERVNLTGFVAHELTASVVVAAVEGVSLIHGRAGR
jgi:hypothetical protein